MQLQVACIPLVATLALPLRAQGGVDLKVNNDAPGSVQNETTIAWHMANPGNLVIAFNDGPGSGGATPIGVATSFNSGATWIDQQLGVPPDPFVPGGFLSVIFDPALAWGAPNEFYVAFIGTVNSACSQSGLYLSRSDDGGMNWSAPQALAADPSQQFPGDPNYRFNDRPHVDTAAHGFVAVTWIKDVVCGQPTSDTYFTFGGPVSGPINMPPFPPTNLAPFSVPVIVNDSTGIDMTHAPHVATHPLGKTYVAWADYNALLADASSAAIRLDSAQIPAGMPAFGVDSTVVMIDPLPRRLSSSLGVYDEARADTYPVIVVDEADASGNTLFLAYAADPPGPDEGDIFFQRSTNGGATWSVPLRVNDDATTHDQMHPAMAHLQGRPIWIAWYDKRASPFDNAWDVYVARSTDGGATFSVNVRVSDATYAAPTSSGGLPWFGEYLGLATDGRDAMLAFTKSTTDVLGDVFFDRLPGCQFPVASYCTSGTTANGCNALITASGTPSASAGVGFTLSVSSVEGQKQGLVFYGLAGRAALPWGGSSSFLCLKSPTQRTPAQGSGGTNGACDGSLSIDWNLYIATNPGALGQPFSSGDIVDAQGWFRDPPSPKTTSLSNALEFTVCP